MPIVVDFWLKVWYIIQYMITKNIKTNNMTIVRNVAYSQINKMSKNIKEVIEVDTTLLKMIDINMITQLIKSFTTIMYINKLVY